MKIITIKIFRLALFILLFIYFTSSSYSKEITNSSTNSNYSLQVIKSVANNLKYILCNSISKIFDFKSIRSGGGGGGGGGSSGGFSSGSRRTGYRSSTRYESSTRIFFVIAGGLVVILFIYFLIKYKKSKKLKELNLPFGSKVEDFNQKKFREFVINNPNFNKKEFLLKVKTAFFDIQNAWSEKDLSKVRKYISDGVYQRYNTQFKMMNLLGQENPLSKIKVYNIALQRCFSDGDYSIIDVKIDAGMFDQFVCKSHPELNSPGGWEDFTEYWSFIQKRGIISKDIFNSNRCPNCDAELQKDMGEVCKCQFCGAFINSGEFDWVLSEITQENDYKVGHTLTASSYYQKKLKDFMGKHPDFCSQLVEDKASNGYMQIMTAITLKEPSIMRRFVTDNAFEKFKRFIADEDIVFNRLYLNTVMLYDLNTKNGTDFLVFLIRKSFQRIKMLDNNRIKILDEDIKTENEYLVMQRDVNPEISKSSIYVHLCSSCGASIEDSLDIYCNYCGSLLNSSKKEWIIADIVNNDELDVYLG